VAISAKIASSTKTRNRKVPTTLNAMLLSSTRRHTSCYRDWSSDVCSSDLGITGAGDSGGRHRGRGVGRGPVAELARIVRPPASRSEERRVGKVSSKSGSATEYKNRKVRTKVNAKRVRNAYILEITEQSIT